MRLCAVSVDLDEIPNYFSIYGLPEPTGPERHAVYDVALARLSTFARNSGLPLTLFAIVCSGATGKSEEQRSSQVFTPRERFVLQGVF